MTIQMPTFRTLSRHTTPAVPLKFRAGFAHPDTPYYELCVDSVKEKYFTKYGAVVNPRPDLFVTARDNTFRSATFNRTLGVAGLTSAAGRRLLSENYLVDPVEWTCAELAGEPVVDRGRIAEMGPMASFYPGTAMFLMRNLPRIARSAGYDFILSTLTEELHDIARIAGWQFHTIANARRADLAPVNATDWGSYYTAKPRTGILRCG